MNITVNATSRLQLKVSNDPSNDSSADDSQIEPSELWMEALRSLNDWLLIVSSERQLIGMNHNRLAQGSQKEIAKHADAHEIIHPSCKDENCYFLKAWAKHRRTQDVVKHEVFDEALNRWIHLTIRKLDERGSTRAWRRLYPYAMITLQDASEPRRRSEMEGRKTRFESLKLMAQGVAHEIGNPLAAIQTSLEVLRENVATFDQEKVITYCDRILESITRLQKIVDRSLKSGEAPALHLCPQGLNDFLTRAEGLFSDVMMRKGIRFEVIKCAEADVCFQADITAAEEALVNVVKNALEATPRGKAVRIWTNLSRKTLDIKVVDQGIGIAQEAMAFVFQPFFSTKPGGHGIGLAYTNYLMNKMNGGLNITSSEGSGTEVILTFMREHNSVDANLDPDS